ncbi:MAG: YkgJ family cysteine cluster protein [Dorea sp.]
MLREIDLKEVSDGKLYSCNDMAKTDCGGCQGCSSCCQGMGSSIVLDPMDIYLLDTNLNLSFEELLDKHLELNVVDGIILPNLKMSDDNNSCSFLDENGRCSIHSFRPGICRLFPLGRFYENNSFQYFLQLHECPKPNKAKVKIKKWLGVQDVKKYENFITKWHYFLKNLQEHATKSTLSDPENDQSIKELSLYILKLFYIMPYSSSSDFYVQFERRLKKAMGDTESLL